MSTDLAILSSHLSTLIEARSVSQHELDPLVAYAISETQDGRTPDLRRAQWEYLLKHEVFKLAATEGDLPDGPTQVYFDDLKSRLDLVLAFTEHDVCDSSFPFSVLEDLLEAQTVASCWHIFSWIEERTERLTTNMVPAKGKSLVLLRTLNDLLRRLSKTGKNTMFCGRILNFLSNVFSLGERSGVNLRGDYGPQWDLVVKKEPAATSPRPAEGGDDVKMEESKESEVQATKPEEQSKSLAEKTEETKKEDFFQTFWSLQLPFSRPNLFAHTVSFESFKDSVNTVLPVIAEATKKERAMMGSKVVAGNLKRKREASPLEGVDDAGRDYFFAKFLTSPELLDLEIADTLFRRQFLFQLLIILQHLNSFTQSEKTKWEGPRNRSLQMDFTLSAADSKWTQDTWTRAMDELKATTPNGKAFADTVAIILERERNWIKWKNELCPPFDKEPIQPTLDEQTRDKRRKLMEAPSQWRYPYGTAALTEVWQTGFQNLSDLENPPEVGDLKDLARDIKRNEQRAELRKKQIALAAPKPASPSSRETAVNSATASQESASSQGTLQTSSPAPSQTSAPAPVQAAATSPPVTAAPIPISTAPTNGPASLHPSLPPRPVASPAPFTKPQTPTRPPPSSATTSQPTVPKPAVPSPPRQDPQLVGFAENKDRLSWLALRRARTEYLPHFGKIGTGDVDMLMTSIKQEEEKEKEREREKAREKENGNSEKVELPSAVGEEPAEKRLVNGDRTKGEEGSSPESAGDLQHTPAPPKAAVSMEIDS